MTAKTATLKLDDKEIVLPIVVGSEQERGVDVRKLRDETGYITFDDGYANTGACESKVTFIDGEKGILRYRGYAIEDLAEKSNFIETAYLLIYGELPTAAQLTTFKARILDNSQVHEGLRIALSGFRHLNLGVAHLKHFANRQSGRSGDANHQIGIVGTRFRGGRSAG